MADKKNKNDKTPNPTTSDAAAVEHVIRKQKSRILGQPSQQSLSNIYTKDLEKLKQENSSTAESTTPSPSFRPVSPNQDAVSPPKRYDSWSLWPRKESRPVTNTTPEVARSSASVRSERSQNSHKSTTSQDQEGLQVQPSENPHQDQTQISQPQQSVQDNTNIASDSEAASIKSKEKSDVRKDRNSWINWKKPSFTSLKNATSTPTEQSPQPDIPPSPAQNATLDANRNDTLKSVERDETKPTANSSTSIPVTAKETTSKERQSSWSFWNNSTTTTPIVDSKSNIILSGGEAILFEPHDVNSKKNEDPTTTTRTSKTPKTINKVVPEFKKSLPYYSTATSILNNYNSLKYTLGFEVSEPKHLYRISTPPTNIKKVLIIGVHGFFPTKVLRPLIGEPTGTSIKFANEAEKAIWRWSKQENISISVQKIALEREGKIFDRVEFFYEVLKKWTKDINEADFIFIAAHSQGCPVSILLLNRLIEDGVLQLNRDKRISLLCMAGVNNGPFYGVDQKLFVRAYSTIENDSLMELFQFQNFDSIHSREFLQSLKNVIKRNVKISFIGSINDQLVPLYSSTCLHVRHPNIFRATYIDGSSNTPDFVSKAVEIANHLHNIGLSDHGVIKEISNSLAGPLTGGGHSKIYNDPQVYDCALNFGLYTNDLKYDIPLHFKPYSLEQLGMNPYHLPWCMRGLLFEARANLQDADSEINELFQEFENWKPETKQLKDMKYRLNGIKSKL